MRITRKIELINKLTEALNERYDEVDQEHFFKSFDADIKWGQDYNEHYIDVKNTLHNLNNIVLKEIAEELEVATEHIIVTPPKNWEKSNNVKAFISHLAEKKDIAMRLREELKPFHIDCFVAHEDIKPSEEWEDEINKALQTMDFFISIHTKGFCQSIWCQQEIGYAVARGIKIIPIKFDGEENPQGFISKYQAYLRGRKHASVAAREIVSLLKDDTKTKNLYNEIINPTISEDEEMPF